MNRRYLSLRRKIQDALFRTEIGRRILVGRGLEVPNASWDNRTLKSTKEWQDALEYVERLGLPPHREPTKNWDSLAALACILKRTTKEARILDAGAELYSVILPWLCLYGYRDLHGINIAFDSVVRRGPITYDYGDVTNTRFDECSFDAVTCLSVIEHGVDVEKFFPEMHRFLKPGGVLIISVDYFETPIDTSGREAYGVPVHIYTREQITWMADIAAGVGLKLTGPLDLHTGEKVIRWEKMELEYTYLLFVMEKFTGSFHDENLDPEKAN